MNAIAEPMTMQINAIDDAGAEKRLRRLAIVVRDDAYDRLLTPLTFAYEMGRKGVQVDMIFVLWAVRVLTRDGVRDVKIDPRYADREEWLRERLAAEGAPLEIHDFIKAIHATENVRLYGCQLAAMTFGVKREDLLFEATGIIHPGEFMNEIAIKADHCQYF